MVPAACFFLAQRACRIRSHRCPVRRIVHVDDKALPRVDAPRASGRCGAGGAGSKRGRGRLPAGDDEITKTATSPNVTRGGLINPSTVTGDIVVVVPETRAGAPAVRPGGGDNDGRDCAVEGGDSDARGTRRLVSIRQRR